MRIQTILVPVDFSVFSEPAFQWALDIATNQQATVLLMHAVHPLWQLPFPENICVTDFPTMAQEIITEAKKRLAGFVTKETTRTVSVTTQVVVGNPVWEICQVATRAQVDLIVLGSHGRTGLSHALLGSVAERVVRHAPCPVLVVRRPR